MLVISPKIEVKKNDANIGWFIEMYMTFLIRPYAKKSHPDKTEQRIFSEIGHMIVDMGTIPGLLRASR